MAVAVEELQHLQGATRPSYVLDLSHAVSPELTILRHQTEPNIIFDTAHTQEAVIRLTSPNTAMKRISETYVLNNVLWETAAETTAPLLEDGRKISNAIRLHMYTNTGEFGDMMQEAMDDRTFAGHNHQHFRLVDKHIDAIVLHTSPDEYNYQEGKDNVVVEALGNFAYSHDLDQLFTEHRNYHTGTTLDTKTGHKPAGAVYALLTPETYVSTGWTTYEKAEEITGIVGLLNLIHGEPKAWQGTQPAYYYEHGERKLLHGQELVAAYKQHVVDPFTLARSQVMEIVVMEKSQEVGFITPETPHGLHPAMESVFQSQLAALTQDHRPMLEHLSEKQKHAVRLAAATVNAADQLEMVVPFDEAQVRKINVNRSIKRAFMQDDVSNLRASIKDENKHHHSDASRALNEYYKLAEIIQGTPLEQNPYVSNYFRDVQILGVLHFKDMGETIMRGNSEEITQLFTTMYHNRIVTAGNKMVKAYTNYEPANSTAEPIDDYRERTTAQLHDYTAKKSKHFSELSQGLLSQITITMESLHQKPGGIIAYSPEQVLEFHAACEYTLNLIAQQYNLSPQEINAYRERVKQGETISLPYEGYDSTGTPDRMRVLVK